MGHEVTGLIAKSNILDKIAQKYSFPLPIVLSQGFSLIPLLERVNNLDLFCVACL